MTIHPSQAESLASRVRRRLDALGAHRIGIYACGQHSHELFRLLGPSDFIAPAEAVCFIDDDPAKLGTTFMGLPVRSGDDLDGLDAIVLSSGMHERRLMDRLADRARRARTPSVVPMYVEDDPAALDVDVLLLAESSWFGLDFGELLHRAGRTCAWVSPTGLPGCDEVDTSQLRGRSREQDISRAHWNGLNLFELVRGSAACRLKRARVTLDDRAVLMPLMEESVRILDASRRLFESDRAPRSVVVANGLLHSQRAVAEVAIRHGARVIAMEASCFPDLLYAEAGTAQACARTTLSRCAWDRLQARVLSSDERRRIKAYLDARAPHLERRLDSGPQPSPKGEAALRAALDVPADHRVLLLLGQVCSDTSLVYDAPVIDDVVSLAERVTRALDDRPGWTLVIKPHPKEATGRDPLDGEPYTDITHRRLIESPIASHPRVRIAGGSDVNVYSLMALADVGVTINSQAGLEMVGMLAKPVLVCGDAFYARRGFTLDVAHDAALAPTLHALLDDPALRPEAHERALTFLHHMIFEYLQPADIDADPARAQRLLDLLATPPSVSPEAFPMFTRADTHSEPDTRQRPHPLREAIV